MVVPLRPTIYKTVNPVLEVISWPGRVTGEMMQRYILMNFRPFMLMPAAIYTWDLHRFPRLSFKA